MAHVADDDPRRRARTLSRLSAAEDLGEMSGPIVAGLVWSLWGVPAVLILRIGLALATEGFALRLNHRAAPRPTHQPHPTGRIDQVAARRTSSLG